MSDSYSLESIQERVLRGSGLSGAVLATGQSSGAQLGKSSIAPRSAIDALADELEGLHYRVSQLIAMLTCIADNALGAEDTTNTETEDGPQPGSIGRCSGTVATIGRKISHVEYLAQRLSTLA